MKITINNNTVSLENICEEHSQELFVLTDSNRHYLKQWLPWLDYVQTENDTLNFIKYSIKQYEQNLGPIFVIKLESVIIGVIGFHSLDKANKIGEIGYWLSQDKQGLGIITQSCKSLIEFGFTELQLNRIQIPAAENNLKSRSIPERLGFTFEGIIRERENLYGKFVNHAMYSILKNEFITKRSTEFVPNR